MKDLYTPDAPEPAAPKMREDRVIGPPGAGKTYYLSRQLEHAAAAFGGAKVVVCSLTRSAAANIAGRQESIPRKHIGTIHSLAFRAVGASTIAESHVTDFNRFCESNGQPAMKLSDVGAQRFAASVAQQQKGAETEDPENADAPSPGAAGSGSSADDLLATLVADAETRGDQDLAEMNRLRARLVPREQWPDTIRGFDSMWSNWKGEIGALDFTDLLEIALRDVETCPGDPAAFFADESQDFSRLAFALARKWGERALRFIHVGDPDQILYEWAGVDPQAFYSRDLPPDQQRVLHRSFRVPAAVHELANKWIEQTPQRRPVVWQPRVDDSGKPVEGRVRRDISGHYRAPLPIVRDAKRYLDQGKSVMFATSCAYMLADVIAALRAEGIPFHNPYRITRGDWNPMARGKRKTTTLDRLISFVKVNEVLFRDRGDGPTAWTYKDVARWMDWLDSGFLKHGARAESQRYAKATPDEPFDMSILPSWFHNLEAAGWGMLDGVPEWYVDAIKPEHRRQLSFPLTVLEKRGIGALIEKPLVTVGTIHSVKGGECDVVYLFPDLSPRAHIEWQKAGGGREGIRRAIYVGMTRAREELIICPPASSMSVMF